MANNCLVTKLKGTVNNDSLLKLGELRFKLPSGLTKAYAGQYGAPVEISLISGTATAYKGSGESQVQVTFPVTAGDGVGTYITTTSECVVSVISKYELTSISGIIVAGYIDLAELKYCKTINNVSTSLAPAINIFGDIKDLLNENTPVRPFNTEAVSFANCREVYGDFSDLAYFTSSVNTSKVNVYNSKIAGTIEKYVAKCVASPVGITTKSNIDVEYPNGLVTFQGVVVTGNTGNILKWKPTETTIAGAVTDICFKNVAIAIDADGNKVGDATPW
jgi:hypothetical protein